MSVGHEILDTVDGQHLLDPGPHAPLAATVAARRGGPLVPRPIGALRQPDAPGRPPEVAAVGLDRGAQLQVDRLVARQERQVAVGRRAGDDLHVATPLAVRESGRDATADPPMHPPHPLAAFFPEISQAYDFLPAVTRS